MKPWMLIAGVVVLVLLDEYGFWMWKQVNRGHLMSHVTTADPLQTWDHQYDYLKQGVNGFKPGGVY